MRLGSFAFIAAVCLAFAAPAAGQTSITLAANPAPIVEATINGRAVRLEVDLRMIDALAVSAPSAERLGLRRMPFARIQIGLDGAGSIRGRVARPHIVFDGRDSRVFAGIFPVPVSERADGVIGPGALPHDIITVVLQPETGVARDIVLTLENPDLWTSVTQVGGESVRLYFDVAGRGTVFNRSAARQFDRAGAIPAVGDLTEEHVFLGLRAMMQPVRTELTVEGLSLGPTFARTNAPLLGMLEEDALVVEAEMDKAPPPVLSLGRAALTQAGCASISVDRRTRRMTLRCAG